MDRKRVALPLFGLFLSVGCGDDGSETTGAATSFGSGSETGNDAGGSDATGAGEVTGRPTSAGTAGGTGTDDTPGTSTGGGSGSGTAGGSDGGTAGTTGADTDGLEPGQVLLQNDSWTPADGLVWQTWPGPGDCWAAIYNVASISGAYDVVALRVAIGGDGATETYDYAIWSVGPMGAPDAELGSGSVDIQGDVGMFEIDVTGLGLASFDGEAFAAVMCHADHRGAPSVAVDADGSVRAAGNWVYQVATEEWVQSPDFAGTAGDFILRAVVQQ